MSTEERIRQARAQRTRAQILESASTAFAAHGYDGVSLNQVIRDSGLTKGAFYFHFPSRDELALAAFRHKQEQLVARIGERVDADAPPLERLKTILRERAALLEEDPSLFVVVRLGIELTTRHGAGGEHARFSDLPLALFEGLVREGQRRGEIRRDLEPRAAAETIFAAILGIDQVSLVMRDRLDVVERTERLLEVLVPGLAAAIPPRRKPNRKESS